jgi:DNA-binding CsgD family transcriptional regulator
MVRVAAQVGAVNRTRPAGVVMAPYGRVPRSRLRRRAAALVAAGQSNPDIAAQLFISCRTAESHVSRILAKLQVSSRWEVKDAAEQAAAVQPSTPA